VSIALKNTSALALTAIVQFLDQDGVPVLTLGDVQVAANEARVITTDLNALAPLKRVSVHINNSGQAGSLVGVLHATDSATGLGYEMPLREFGGPSASTGGYPWRLDGDYKTNIILTNAGTVPVRFSARLHNSGSDYVFQTKELPAGASVVYDFRDLRDNQVKDAFGHTIQLDVDHGQFYWSILGATPGAHMLGRSEIVSQSQHFSSSFSCQMPCPDSLVDSWIGSDNTVFPVEDTTNIEFMQTLQDSSGHTWDEGATFDSVSYNSSLVTLHWDGGAHYYLSGENAGTTSVEAAWEGASWHWVDPQFSEDIIHCESEQVSARPTREFTPFTFAVATGGEVWPSSTGASGASTSTTITVTTIPQVSVDGSMIVVADEYTGGHVHGGGGRPKGSVGSNAVSVFDGVGHKTFTSSPVSGIETVSVKIHEVTKSTLVFVGVPNLQPLGGGNYYELTGGRTEHPAGTNHFGTPQAVSAMPLIASDYHAAFSTADTLWYNDMSLQTGGLFDITGAWMSPHSEHRLGINCDVTASRVPSANRSTLLAIFLIRGSTRTGDEVLSLNHWHLRFE
jgi:hypothetical protein